MVRVRNSLVSFSVLSLALSGCDLEKPDPSSKSADQLPDWIDKDKTEASKSHPSDIQANKQVPLCASGQPYAFEECWDSVFFSDQGEVSLIKNSQKEILFDRKTKFVSPRIAKYYAYKEQFLDRMVIENPLMAPYTDSSFWFLPNSFELSDPLYAHTIKNNLVKSGAFNLIDNDGYHFNSKNEWVPTVFNELKGSIQLKGRIYSLPITQKTLQDVCLSGLSYGDYWLLVCDSEYVKFTFHLTHKPNEQTLDVSSNERRVANKIDVLMK